MNPVLGGAISFESLLTLLGMLVAVAVFVISFSFSTKANSHAVTGLNNSLKDMTQSFTAALNEHKDATTASFKVQKAEMRDMRQTMESNMSETRQSMANVQTTVNTIDKCLVAVEIKLDATDKRLTIVETRYVNQYGVSKNQADTAAA
jgi:hypothetical protein